MNPSDWAQLGVGVAAVAGLVYVARTMRGLVSDVLNFLGNHMSGVTRSLENLTVSTQKMADRVDKLADEAREARRRGE